MVDCSAPFNDGTGGLPCLPPLLFHWTPLKWHLYFSILRLAQKVEVSPLSHLALAWRISVLLPSLNATVPEERAITLRTNTASGWRRLSSRSSLSVLLPQKLWKQDSFEQGSAVAKCAWRTCSNKNAVTLTSLRYPRLDIADVKKDKCINLFCVWLMGESRQPVFYKNQVSSPGVWLRTEEEKISALKPLF